MTFEFLRPRAVWLSLLAASALVAIGCEPPPKAPPAGAGQGSGAPAGDAPAVSPSTPTPPAGVPTPSDSGAAPAAPAETDSSGIPVELIKQVNELVRLTKEYNAIASTIQTRDDYVKNQDKLSALDEQLQPYVIGLEVDQAKLPPGQRAEFDRKYYEGLAKPVVEEKRAHTRRFATLQ